MLQMQIRDITSCLITEVCHNVLLIEPPLQELTGEAMSYQPANIQDQSRLDVAADGFWACSQQQPYISIYTAIKRNTKSCTYVHRVI